MGRPIKKKFFGNLITPFQNHATGGKTGVGGEGIASVTISNSGTVYSQGATVSFATPTIAGGITATGTPIIDAAGLVRNITITNSGTGYQAAPVLSITTASSVAKVTTGTSATNVIYPANTTGIYLGMQALGTGISASATYVTSIVGLAVGLTWPNATAVATTVTFADEGAGFANTPVLTSSRQDAIKFTSYLTTGSSAINGGDILKQESSRRYLVQNAQGKGQCKLVTTSTLTAGTMNIVATDHNGSTYFVRKLTAHRAIVVRSTVSTAFLVGNSISTGWTLGSATGTVVTIAHTV